MQLITVSRVLSLLLAVYSVSFLLPMLVAWWYREDSLPFFLTIAITLLFAGLLYIPTIKRKHTKPRLKDGFLIVVGFWLILGLVGTIPFALSGVEGLVFADMVFEAFSGLTTTGATIFSDIESLPRSLLFYRQQLQWFGGMGIIVFAIAVLPVLGVGGQLLFNAELASPIKDSKISPRISQTAKALWGIYVTFTVLCAIAYKIAGMSWFDAIAHSFSTISIGGFSTYSNSLGHFDSTAINLIAIGFMVIAAINFSLHFHAWHKHSIGGLLAYFKDSETKVFIVILAFLSLLSVLLLGIEGNLTWSQALKHGIFQAVSLASTTGFTTTEWFNWPSGLPYILLLASCIGACAGSTGGGMKVIRLMLLFKQGWREIVMLLHPRAIKPLRLSGQVVPERIVNTVWGFFALYVFVFLLFLVLLLVLGMNPISAFSTLTSCLNNLGPALGDASINYAGLAPETKIVLAAAMLVGRLEFYTLIVLFTPVFWRT